MTISVKVKSVSLDGLKAMRSRVPVAKKLLVHSVAQDSNHYMPVETGSLHDSVEEGEDSVKWTAPYARYAWRQPPKPGPNKYGTLPRREWVRAAKRNKMKRWKKVVADAVCGRGESR